MHDHKRGRGGRGQGPARRIGRGEHFGGGRESGFGGGFSGGRGGGRRGKRFAGEELRLMVLALLETGPQHGYQLIRSFAERSGDAYSPSPGVLYPLLTLLADMGLAEEAGEAGTARRSYRLTATGAAELAANRPAAEAALARLAALAEQAGRADAAPVRRAMLNLRTAAIQRLTAGPVDDQTAFAIAAIIDGAAQQIERL